jgi:hypothetical protein
MEVANFLETSEICLIATWYNARTGINTTTTTTTTAAAAAAVIIMISHYHHHFQQLSADHL